MTRCEMHAHNIGSPGLEDKEEVPNSEKVHMT